MDTRSLVIIVSVVASIALQGLNACKKPTPPPPPPPTVTVQAIVRCAGAPANEVRVELNTRLNPDEFLTKHTNTEGVARFVVPIGLRQSFLRVDGTPACLPNEHVHLDINGVDRTVDVDLAPRPPAVTFPGRVRVDGKRFVTTSGAPFVWRGVTAFRLIDHLADGRRDDAIAYLDWAKQTGFNVLRVLTRIDWQNVPALENAELTPQLGREHLPALLQLARDRGLYVEAVATVGTASTPYDWRRHARLVAEICAAAENCLFEFANEPDHPSQDDELHDMANVDRFAAEAVAGLDVVWTAGPAPDDEALVPTGAYVARHLDRGREPLNNVRRIREIRAVQDDTGKPAVSDEPMGADEEDGAVTGRQRWNKPEYFFAMGALCRGFRVGCTFHLQDGLTTRVPRPVQQRCAEAFVDGSRLLADDAAPQYFNTGFVDSPVRAIRFEEAGGSVVRAYSFVDGTKSITVVLHRSATLDESHVEFGNGWRPLHALAAKPNVTVFEVVR